MTTRSKIFQCWFEQLFIVKFPGAKKKYSSHHVLPTMVQRLLSTHTPSHWTTWETCTCVNGSTLQNHCCHSCGTTKCLLEISSLLIVCACPLLCTELMDSCLPQRYSKKKQCYHFLVTIFQQWSADFVCLLNINAQNNFDLRKICCTCVNSKVASCLSKLFNELKVSIISCSEVNTVESLLQSSYWKLSLNSYVCGIILTVPWSY